MLKINLVPNELIVKARQRQFALQVGLMSGALCAVLLVVSLLHWFAFHLLQNEYSYKQEKLKELSEIVAKVEELQKAADSVRARLGVISGLLKGRALYPLFMSEFARTVPSSVRVTQLTTTVQGSALKLAITALANKNDDPARWMHTLEQNSHFSGVELGPVNLTGARQYNFTLETIYTLKI